MSEVRDGLHLIPEHMHETVVLWAERAEPHPQLLGHFMRAALTNKFVETASRADQENQAALFGWAVFLYNYMPGPSWGSEEALLAWHERHHRAEVADA